MNGLTRKLACLGMTATLTLVLLIAGGCEGSSGIGGLNVKGTYRLVKRELPDGTEQTPPTVDGLMILSRDYRNLNLFWTDEAGKTNSVSNFSRYTLNRDVYSETNIFHMANMGDGVTYDMSAMSGGAPITRIGQQWQWQLPLRDEPSVVFTNSGFTATKHGEFVDHWDKVN